MKIYTNENNLSTLKLLIAHKLACKKEHLEVVKASFNDAIFEGPRCLPLLVVDGDHTLFSSNAALLHLMPAEPAVLGQCEQLLEWEASRLTPIVVKASSADVAADCKQALQACLQTLNGMLEKKYLCGGIISPADICIFSALYPLHSDSKGQLKQCLNEQTNVVRWFNDVYNTAGVQETIEQWRDAGAPYAATSALGAPLPPSLASPGSPEEEAVIGPTPEEIEIAKDNWLNGVKKLQPPLKQEKLVLPIKGRRNVLITSALPYVNNVPHLGNIIGCVLSADIFARYCRMCDYNTLFVCGTDEYGTATETKALEEGVTPRQICDKYFAIHNAVYRWFNIGFDYFGRTSTPEQTEIAQRMFLKLRDNGFVSCQTVDQLLCEQCDRFLADRFVEGTCPHPGCLYDSARGDQCDKCGKLINATELIQPRCKVCGHPPVIKPSQQLFIELGQLEPGLRSWISSRQSGWSAPARAVTRAWLREPLRPRAVTRDLKWGVPVPVEGFTDKVFYVWFDAPIGYLSITHCATKQFESWWKPDPECDVKLYQFMAKDNVPFHVIMFPATVLGVNEGHKMVDHIFATEYLNYEDGKFSKSRGVGVFGNDAQDTGIPSDVWRFYLASIRPETSDSSFSWNELGTRNNSELLNNLGNFIHRSLSFCSSSFRGVVPTVAATGADYELMALVNREIAAYVHHMEKGRLREALKHVLAISRIGNQHMQSRQPWVLLKGTADDKVLGATAVGVCCHLVALLCCLLEPYTPDTARRLRTQLAVTASLRLNPQNPTFIQYLPPNHMIGTPEPLFTKLEPDRLEQLKAKYAGTQSDRAKLNGDVANVAELEAAIAAQGDKVRQLKSSAKDKTVWQPEVEKLLALKKQLATAQTVKKELATAQTLKKQVATAQSACAANTSSDVDSLEKAIAEQGNKVRQLKSSTKDKTVWQPEVDKLLALKKQLATAETLKKELATTQTQSRVQTTAQVQDTVDSLERAIAEQGDKVRKLKASTKEKAVWQPEVNILLDLKKRLANLQISK